MIKACILKLFRTILIGSVSITAWSQDTLTNAEIWDLHPGDVLQFKYNSGYDGSVNTYNAFHTWTILDRQLNATADTLFFTFQEEGFNLQISPAPPSKWSYQKSKWITHLNDLWFDPVIFQDSCFDYFFVSGPGLGNVTKNAVWNEYNGNTYSCWFEPIFFKSMAFTGLGTYNAVYDAHGLSYENTLLYYSKSGASGGTFVSEMDEKALDDIQFYPNPAADQVFITGLIPGKKWQVQITDLAGRIICQANSEHGELNVSMLKSGQYFIQLLEDGIPTGIRLPLHKV